MDSARRRSNIEVGTQPGRRNVHFADLVSFRKAWAFIVKLMDPKVAVKWFFFMCEVVSCVLENFFDGKVVRVIGFLLAVVGFGITVWTCFVMEKREQAEKLLVVLEIGFSVVMLIAATLELCDINGINKYTTSVLLIWFGLISVIYTCKHRQKVSPANEDGHNESVSIEMGEHNTTETNVVDDHVISGNSASLTRKSIYKRRLSVRDLFGGLALPDANLNEFPPLRRRLFRQYMSFKDVEETNRRWRFSLTICDGTPAFWGEWKNFVERKGLVYGNGVEFFKEENEATGEVSYYIKPLRGVF